jgi:hypothetical protein
MLLKNGYFLTAYALFVGRNHRNINFILKYFKAVYQNYAITIGIDELKSYLNLDSDIYKEISDTKH